MQFFGPNIGIFVPIPRCTALSGWPQHTARFLAVMQKQHAKIVYCFTLAIVVCWVDWHSRFSNHSFVNNIVMCLNFFSVTSWIQQCLLLVVGTGTGIPAYCNTSVRVTARGPCSRFPGCLCILGVQRPLYVALWRTLCFLFSVFKASHNCHITVNSRRGCEISSVWTSTHRVYASSTFG